MQTRALAAIAIAAVGASFFLYLGAPPLFDVDEGAFSQATLEMFQRGDFLSTYLNGEPRYDKPILVYWLQAASVLAFGPTEFAFRFPSAICGTLWCALIFAFGRQFYGVNAGLAAGTIAAASVGVFAISRAATADALLNLLIAASMFSAWLYLQRGERKWLYAAFAAAALGVLAKGPVAVLVPGAVTLIFCLIRRDLRTWIKTILDPRALALFALIAVPWYLAIFYKEGWAFFEGFVMKHNVRRFGSTLQSHGGSLIYYFPVVLIATLPHTGLFTRIFIKWKEAWRDDLQCYLLLWFAFVFVFFSFSGTKLPHYVLYGLSGMFVLMGLHAGQAPSRWWLVVPLVLFFAFLFALPDVVERAASRVHDGYYDLALADVKDYFPASYYLLGGAAALVLLWLTLSRRVESTYKVAAVGALSAAVLAVFVLPAAGSLLQDPVKQAALLARERNYDVVMWGINAPSFSVYYGRPTLSRTPRAGDVVITRSKRLAELPAFDTIYARKGVALVKIKS